MAYIQPENAAPSWEQMMEDTHATVKGLDSIYTRLLRQADQLKRGNGDLRAIEKLLDQTLPVTEEDRRLTFFMSFMASLKRGDLIAFLFKIRRACLLLLIDGHAAATALNLSDTHDIWIDEDGRYRISPIGGGQSEPARPRQNADGYEEPRRRNRGRRNRGGRDQDRAASPVRASRGAATGKPVMNMEECQHVLATIDEPAAAAAADEPAAEPELPAVAPAKAAPEGSYLTALIRGKTADPAPKPAPVEVKTEPAAAVEAEANAEPAVATEPAAATEPKAEPAAATEAKAESPAESKTSAKDKLLSMSWADMVDDEDEDELPVPATAVSPRADARPPARAADARPPARAADARPRGDGRGTRGDDRRPSDGKRGGRR